MKEYELTVLIHPDLEATLDGALEKVRGIITNAGGEITGEDNWGKKRLQYRIRRQDFAMYVAFELNLPADAPLKISNTLNITEEVLRYLLVSTSAKIREAREKAAVAASAPREDDRDERGDREERGDRGYRRERSYDRDRNDR